MKKLTGTAILAVLMVAFVASLSLAAVNSNGFPSGPHFNLNIIGKKAAFTCPEQEYDSITGAPVYGNVVFVPQNGRGIQILMQSGSTKGKTASTFTELRATDPCSGFDGDGAVIQLPPRAEGYRVYGRALAKPTDSPDMTISPSLVSAVDELGNDLVYLGLVTSNGFVKADPMVFTRTKGKSTAVDITGLFEWSGQVCYFSPPDGTYTASQTCVIDLDGDGIYDSATTPVAPDDPTFPAYCPDPAYTLVTTYCRSYQEEWVFNIADFVEYLWSLDNNGSRLVQIRFYPN